MRVYVKHLCAALAIALALFAAPVQAHAWQEHDYIISSGHGTFSPQCLVIHSTANPGATAWNHVQYWQRLGNRAEMTQWVCDWTDGGTVYQVAPGNAVTWHVGNGNLKSVGIEICEGTTREQVDLSIDTAAQWAAYYLKSKGWGIERMVSHDEARALWGGTDHTDPNPYFSRWGYTWQGFENKVSSYMRGDSGEPDAGVQVPNLGDPAWTGNLMWAEMQSQLRTPVDGFISGQTSYNSRVVQWAVTVSPAQPSVYGSTSVRALQNLLLRNGYSVGASGADGHMGHDTVRALQMFLNDRLGCGLEVDGFYGNLTSKAVCDGLNKKLFK